MSLKIALIQVDICWENASLNRKRLSERLSAVEADLIVLPETFTTGFAPSPSVGEAETMDGETVEWMRRTAFRTGAALAGSLPLSERGVVYNRFLFVTPEGGLYAYDKRHLFRMGGERGGCRPGERRVIVEYKGWRIFLSVCYDLRFPVWCRNRGDYDLMLCCASWPASRREVWNLLLRARAVENLCYVAGVNRVGSDPFVPRYAGDSTVVDFRGGTLARAPEDKEAVVTTVLEREPLLRFREKFPAHLDADDFRLE